MKKGIWQTVVFTSFVNGNRDKVIFYADDRERTIPKFATVKKYRVGNRTTGLVKAEMGLGPRALRRRKVRPVNTLAISRKGLANIQPC